MSNLPMSERDHILNKACEHNSNRTRSPHVITRALVATGKMTLAIRSSKDPIAVNMKELVALKAETKTLPIVPLIQVSRVSYALDV
jgi:hypothetical protein